MAARLRGRGRVRPRAGGVSAAARRGRGALAPAPHGVGGAGGHGRVAVPPDRAALTDAPHMTLWAVYPVMAAFTARFARLGISGFRRRVLS